MATWLILAVDTFIEKNIARKKCRSETLFEIIFANLAQPSQTKRTSLLFLINLLFDKGAPDVNFFVKI